MTIVDWWKSLRSINLYKKWQPSLNHQSSIENHQFFLNGKTLTKLFFAIKNAKITINGLIRFHQSIQNQTVKRIVSGNEQPPQMKQALVAKGNFPTEAFKPCEFVCLRAGITATDSRLKAADFINNSTRIGKRVHVGSVDNNSVGGPGDRLKALCAANILVFLDDLLFRNEFLGSGSSFVFGGITKE